MFVRKKQNASGSLSIQIISKSRGKYKVVSTVDCAMTKREEELLILLAKSEMERIQGNQTLFAGHDDLVIENFVNGIANDHLQIIGSELILGKIYRKIGFPEGGCPDLFKNLVLCRLIYPGSKLKTTDYFKQHLNTDVSVYSIYRFLDELNSELKPAIEQTMFDYTLKLLKNKIGVVFYDMTTLYFEASEEDDYRIPGFNKDGKYQQPQIMIGLLVSNHGYPIGYQIFEGNTSETKTLIPVLETFQKKFDIDKPIIVADAALLSQKRARNDRINREKGLKRLEKKLRTGKLTKDHINNRGYNKYLKLSGEVSITIDYEKYEADSVWDGLKGYVTNTHLSRKEVIGQYSQLWQVERFVFQKQT